MLSPASHSAAEMSATESASTQPCSPLHTESGKARIDSARLMQGMRELLIAHAGEEYRLRLTRNDRLILTK